MENNIITWDFMGWQATTAPDVGVQLNWNKTLLEVFTKISSQINRNSLRGGARHNHNVSCIGRSTSS